MKTTLEMPDALVRQAKVLAAREGTTFRAIMTRALETELAAEKPGSLEPRWLRHVGRLQHLHEETAKVNRAIEDAFEGIDEDIWQ